MLSWRGADDGIGFGNFFIPLLQDDSAIDLRTALYVCAAAPVLGAALTALLPPTRARTRLAPEVAPS